MPIEAKVWTEFRGELESRTMQMVSELARSWRELSAVTAGQRERFSALGKCTPPGDRPSDLDDFFGSRGLALLTDPLAEYSQKRPLHRSISAMEEHESAVGDLLRRLPRTAELNGQDLLELVGMDWRSPIGLWRSLRRKPRTVAFRDAVSDRLLHVVLARAALDGAFQLLLAEAALHLLVPWQTCRRGFLVSLARSERERVDIEATGQWWNEAADRHEQRAALLLARYDAWARSISSGVVVGLLRNPHPASSRKRNGWENEHQTHLSFWSRQQRAVRAVIDLELHLAKLARETTADTASSLDALDTEHTELIEELAAAIDWLQQWPGGETSASFPQPKARLLSSDERLAEWLRRVSARARGELPAAIETVAPNRPLPGWRKPWRDLEPARVFLNGLSTAGAPILLTGFQEAEAVHRAVVREIERAREVVDFGFETTRLEAGATAGIATEAVGNALSLLTYQKEATPEIRVAAEVAAAHAAAAVLLETDLALERGRIGLLAHVTRQRGRQALRQFRSLAERGVQTGSRGLWLAARRIYRQGLLKIGWIAAPRQLAQPVVRRADLSETLEVQLRARELPMIYRRLFRLAPVEDPRFLVGRDAEMAGFADARKRWDTGKGASVIVVGARGSGKTSLVNCAAAGVFTGCEVIRGQFCDRPLTPPEMFGFLRGLLPVPPGADVTATLCDRRRVILLEEFERTFLRVVNGFAALRTLLDVMYSTSRSTLWIFSVNETAYRYLDAVAGLGRHFSHHINAMSVRQDDLTNAILQRHNLSGLRLEFAPLPEEDPRVSGVRRFLGLEQDSRKVFLDSLYEQSEGIFRAAFELWQGSVERVEGGIVHIRQPLAPDYQKLAAEMTLEDCFALKAILQHGSLTAEELALVLTTTQEESRRQLERLHLLDVLEPEPVNPGVRVRPEAGRLVRETLIRRNLL